MSTSTWQPSADMATLQARAELLDQVRTFFRQRGVLEVETPLLCSSAGTDPQLQPIVVEAADRSTEGSPRYLQTSPEFAMKRLLAAGSGPLYQICKAFREGDTGQRHNPEFTMLEWYRPGFDEQQLMDEVAQLVAPLLKLENIPRLSYRQVFCQLLDIDPHQASLEVLKALARTHIELQFDTDDRDVWLDLLFSHLIEPQLQQACFIHDYPASQAALARLAEDEQGTLVAKRFELLVGGMELANGYFELSDAAEQARRFQSDLAKRRELARPDVAVDQHLLAALAHGLPDCAGVALGLDRLLMLQLGLKDIAAVLSFDVSRV